VVEIIPAIIPKSFSDLKEKLSLVSGLAPLVQIDISDGKFTKNLTWPFKGHPMSTWTSNVQVTNLDPDFIKIIKEEEGFPFWQDLEFETHLMVENPEAEIQKWISAGAKRVLVHYESFDGPEKVLNFCKNFKEKYAVGYINIELGIALNLETDTKVLEPLITHINFIQLMSISKIGFQGIGIPFELEVLDKINALHSMFHDLIISVDGGINLGNAKSVIDAGANRLIIGGAIFQSENIRKTISEFKELVI